MLNSFAAALLVASLATPGLVQTPAAPGHLKASTLRVVKELAPVVPAVAGVPSSAVARRPRHSVTRIVTGAVLGGAAGFFAGGYLGYQFERGFKDCGCDDPGMKGIMIGAPIGAVVGAILGGKFF